MMAAAASRWSRSCHRGAHERQALRGPHLARPGGLLGVGSAARPAQVRLGRHLVTGLQAVPERWSSVCATAAFAWTVREDQQPGDQPVQPDHRSEDKRRPRAPRAPDERGAPSGPRPGAPASGPSPTRRPGWRWRSRVLSWRAGRVGMTKHPGVAPRSRQSRRRWTGRGSPRNRLLEQAGQAAVGQRLAAGLAGGAVLQRRVGERDLAHRVAAYRARQPGPAVHPHRGSSSPS